MADPRRVALLFDLHRADHHIRQLVAGIGRYAAEAAGRWRLVLDPFADLRLACEPFPAGSPSPSPGAAPAAAQSPRAGGAVRPFDGFLGPGSTAIAERARKAGIPYVAATCDAVSLKFPKVVENRWQAGRLAIDHLRALGHLRFACLRFDRDGDAHLLEQTFRYHARRHGTLIAILRTALPTDSRVKYWTQTLASIARWLDRLRFPIGILACSDLLARYLVDMVLDRGLRVPDDVAIIGAGNDPVLSSAFPLPLASIDFQWEAIGHRAAQLLDRLMDGAPPPGANVLVAPRLVVRSSAASRPRGDNLIGRALDFIAANCHRPLRVAEIALAIGTSGRTLVRSFRESRRTTVVEEITAARLARARDLLRQSGFTLDAIARATGFGSAHRLARVFRRREGISPSAFRRTGPTRPGGDNIRLDEAKRLLETTRHRLDTIGLLCGYRSQGGFTRAFRRHEGCTPSEYRARLGLPRAGAPRRHLPPPADAARPPLGPGDRIEDLPDTPPWEQTAEEGGQTTDD